MNNNDERQIKACICTCTPPCHSSGRLTFQLIGSAVLTVTKDTDFRHQIHPLLNAQWRVSGGSGVKAKRKSIFWSKWQKITRGIFKLVQPVWKTV